MQRVDRPSPAFELLTAVAEEFKLDCTLLPLDPDLVPDGDQTRMAGHAASDPPVISPQNELAPGTSSESHDGTASPPVTQVGLSPLQKERVPRFRERLRNALEAFGRYPLLRPDLTDLANDFNFILGQFTDGSDLFEAIPTDEVDVRAPKPKANPALLQEVRDSFLKMAPHVTSHLYHPSRVHFPQPPESWNLPPEAREDPLAFWSKIWDSFDFSAPQFFDTTLELDEQ